MKKIILGLCVAMAWGCNIGGPGTGTGGSTGTGGGIGSGGGTGTGGGIGSGGGTGTGGGTGVGGGGGSSVAVHCPHPTSSGIATIAVDFNNASSPSRDNLQLAFLNGALASFDGRACAPDTSGVAAVGDWSTYCNDAYACGGCTVFLLDTTYPAGSTPKTFQMLGLGVATYGATPVDCPDYNATYNVCSRQCDGRECGDDGCGGSCGTCTDPSKPACYAGKCSKTVCNLCLDKCRGLPGVTNCCCGVGCLCQNECNCCGLGC